MNVKHDVENSRFYIEKEGREATLTYRVVSGSLWDIQSTYTPEALRGQGIAGKITKAALEYAKGNNLKVIPSCSYVAEYINRHPEFKDLL